MGKDRQRSNLRACAYSQAMHERLKETVKKSVCNHETKKYKFNMAIQLEMHVHLYKWGVPMLAVKSYMHMCTLIKGITVMVKKAYCQSLVGKC